MKRIISIIVILSLALGVCTTAIGSEYIPEVIVNNSKLNVEEVHITENEQIMIPLRLISEELDYSVKWNNEDQSITVSNEDDIIKLKMGQSKVNMNGKNIDINNSPIIKDSKTLIPIQFFDKVLNLNTGWDSDKKILRINNPRKNSEEYFETIEDKSIQKNLDDYMKSLVEYQNFHGSLLIAKDGKLLFNQGYGFANFEQEIMNKPQTKFAIGSVTKQFTSMAIMQLNEKNLVKLDDKVSKYFPELSQGDKVTIHNLLTHTSGLKDYTSLYEFIVADIKNKDPMAMVNLIKDMPLEFTPGEMYNYSNTNYLLLGMIVENVTNKTLEDYLQENIFNPLNMKDTGIVYGKSNVAPDATAYSGFLEVQVIDDNLTFSHSHGAGNMYSTVEDLYRWDRALKTEKLVSKETMNKIFESYIMFTKTDGYGYGWMIGDTDIGKKVYHGGNSFGFTASLDRYIDRDITIITLINNGYYNTTKLTNDVKSISLKEDYEMPKKLEEVEIEDKEVYEKYVGDYKFVKGLNINIVIEDGKLYALTAGEDPLELFPLGDNKFFAKAADVRIEFVSNDNGEITEFKLQQMGLNFSCEKLGIDESEEAVDVDSEIYEQYTGEYELTPDLIVTIIKEKDKIYAQLTGQDKYEIFPRTETEYYYKVVDAKITFIKDEENNVTGLTLHQNGVEMPAIKK